ncbi:MAG: macro domain-containing protein [Pirellulales bacterium]|nr:macro domain-containing protein [Pirellulales bacterium]
MMRFTQGNLLEADVEALVNTVNTVGVMGKGIALMFKETFPENFKAYAAACKRDEVQVGQMFITGLAELSGPRWIINFPTKKHWKGKSKLEWITEGLEDLRRVIVEKNIRSIAIPPLGSGNGGLDWYEVRRHVEAALGDLDDVDVFIYEPTAKYQNVAKGHGVEKLTPARAIIAELIRRYGILGMACSILEVQKLAWFFSRVIEDSDLADPLNLKFEANRYGPYSHGLSHLLNALDGSYLHCDKRIGDASPFDAISFDTEKLQRVANFFASAEGAVFVKVVEETDALIDGFQSPLGMEALATVDWLLKQKKAGSTLASVRDAIAKWPEKKAAKRKQRLFSDKLLTASIERVQDLTHE